MCSKYAFIFGATVITAVGMSSMLVHAQETSSSSKLPNSLAKIAANIKTNTPTPTTHAENPQPSSPEQSIDVTNVNNVNDTNSAREPNTSLIDETFIQDLRAQAENMVVVFSVNSQNQTHKNLSPKENQSLNEKWHQEATTYEKPLITAKLTNPLSTYLTRLQADSVGLYSEILVMDQNGLNVGQSAMTKDMYHGDKNQFMQTYTGGVNAVIIGSPQFRSDIGIWQTRVHIPVVDSQKQKVIGVANFEINLTELERRQPRNKGH